MQLNQGRQIWGYQKYFRPGFQSSQEFQWNGRDQFGYFGSFGELGRWAKTIL